MQSTDLNVTKWAKIAAAIGAAYRVFFPPLSWFDAFALNLGGVFGGAGAAALMAASICGLHNWIGRRK